MDNVLGLRKRMWLRFDHFDVVFPVAKTNCIFCQVSLVAATPPSTPRKTPSHFKQGKEKHGQGLVFCLRFSQNFA